MPECPNGHVHDAEDLDKIGEDFKCPECHATIPVSEVPYDAF